MAYINFQPQPKIPPIGFFQPISVDPKDMMTDVEFLLGVLKKLNEIIAQTNQNTENEINSSISLQFAEIKIKLQSMVATALQQANAYTDAVAAQLDAKIDAVSVGDIELFDPTTGLYSSIQVVVDNLYTLGRTDALTATEYDALELTATDYDAYELTAFQYDQNGKSLLTQE